MPDEIFSDAETDAADVEANAVRDDAARETAAADEARAKLEAENAELRDRMLRTLAEMDNLRKRTEREVADTRSYAVTAFARDLLTVADNLGRARDAAAAEGLSPEVALAGLTEGVAMTERELLAALARHGVERVDPQGKRFDPHLHQAMFEVPDASVPAGTVVQVAQPGYTISGRVLRPALVGVAKGGPKLAADAGASVDRSA